MASISQKVTQVGTGVAGGFGGTILAREWFDSAKDDSLTRPSVIYGVGTGATMLAAGMLARRGSIDIPDNLLPVLDTWGTVGITSGAFSAAFPKGSGETILPVSQRRRPLTR